MTQQELTEVVDQRMSDPRVLGRMACNLRHSDQLQQRHHDNRALHITWREAGDTVRALVVHADAPDHRVAQIDINEETGSVRVEAFEPCSVTISPDDDLLCLTRYH